MSQLPLFVAPIDERTLSDVDRTILEAIEKLGSITAREAGKIVYRFRGWTLLIATPRSWVISAGRAALDRLARLGLVRRAPKGRWVVA